MLELTGQFRRGLEYLVKLALGGRGDVIEALRLYAAGHSASTITRMVGLPSPTIQSFIWRVNVRIGTIHTRWFLKRVLPLVETIQPIVDGSRCLLCGRTFGTFAALMSHISFRHGDLVEHYVNKFFATQGGGGADGTDKR